MLKCYLNSTGILKIYKANELVHKRKAKSKSAGKSKSNNKKNSQSITKNTTSNHDKNLSSKVKIADKDKNLIQRNTQIYFRKTNPCTLNGTKSVQNQQKTSLNLRNKQKSEVLNKKLKLNKSQETKTIIRNKMSLKCFQIQKKLKQNTVDQQHHQHDNIFAKNHKKERSQRKNIQTCIHKSESMRKVNFKQTAKNALKSKQKLLKHNIKFIYPSKSSCITRNISRNNSNQKYQPDLNEELNKKFKKKKLINQNQQKEKKTLKKQNIYSSTKISQRNSFKIISTENKEFLVVKEGIISMQNPEQFQNMYKKKVKKMQTSFNKIKSEKTIDRNPNFVDNNVNFRNEKLYFLNSQLGKQRPKRNQSIQNDQTSEGQFSFFRNMEKEQSSQYPSQSRINSNNCFLNRIDRCYHFESKDQLSIDRYLECHQNFQTHHQQEFNLQSQQSLKQRLSRQQLSLQKLKEEQFTQPLISNTHNLSSIDALEAFQTQFVHKSRSHSISSQIYNHHRMIKKDEESKYMRNTHLSNSSSKNHRIQFFEDSQGFFQRLELIDWMSMLCSTMLLKTQTYQLAICYLDQFTVILNSRRILENIQTRKHFKSQLKSIGFACLTIAIKMDQRQYEHDIFNAFYSLDNEFNKIQVVKFQLIILKQLKLKLKVQTLSFWLDCITNKWDLFLDNFIQNQHEQILNKDHQGQKAKDILNLFKLRSVEGKSYENYRKLVEMMNAIIMEGGIYKYDLIEIVLSMIFVISEQTLESCQRQKVFKQINTSFNTKIDSLCIQVQNRVSLSQTEEQEKDNILPNYATQQTLDLQRSSECLNDSKQNLQFNDASTKFNQNNIQNCLIRKQIDPKIHEKQHIVLRKSHQKTKKPKSNDQHSQSEQRLKRAFEKFYSKYTQKDIDQMGPSVLYVKDFVQLKFVLEVDQRIYQQAQTYQEFIRYHGYSPHAKLFITKRFEEDLKENQNFKDLNYCLHQQIDHIFTEQEIANQSPLKCLPKSQQTYIF